MREFTERGGWWVVAQVLLFILIGGCWLIWSYDWGPLAVGAGWPVAVMGVVEAVWGLLALGGNLTPYPSPKSDAELIERGPYRVVRHPIYGGLVVAAAGISLVDGNAGALTFTLGLLILFLGKSEFEEERLLRRFPTYAAYRLRVRHRLVPWLV